MRWFVFTVACLALAQPYDIAINHGRVIDPESGLDAVRSVGIRGNTIAAISSTPLAGKREIDATGYVVSPGFIDLHQHGHDEENYRLKVRDGCTTALELEIGVSPVNPWYEKREGKSVVNFGASAGHIGARMIVMKDTGVWLPKDNAVNRTATQEEQKAIRDLIERGLAEGGLGIGFGLNYTPNRLLKSCLHDATLYRKVPGRNEGRSLRHVNVCKHDSYVCPEAVMPASGHTYPHVVAT